MCLFLGVLILGRTLIFFEFELYYVIFVTVLWHVNIDCSTLHVFLGRRRLIFREWTAQRGALRACWTTAAKFREALDAVKGTNCPFQITLVEGQRLGTFETKCATCAGAKPFRCLETKGTAWNCKLAPLLVYRIGSEAKSNGGLFWVQTTFVNETQQLRFLLTEASKVAEVESSVSTDKARDHTRLNHGIEIECVWKCLFLRFMCFFF